MLDLFFLFLERLVQFFDIQLGLAPELEQRLSESLELFFSAMARRPKPIDPNLLNERLLSARWSI